MPRIEAGDIVGGRYRLIRPLGRGSMGEVWVAHHETLGEEVAVKLLAPTQACRDVEDRAVIAARFRFEAQVAAHLSRKTRHIVRVTDHGDEGGNTYLVMELLEGKTLEKHFMLRGVMDSTVASQLVCQLGRALEHAHAEGVIHRDLKPANIFLASDEEGGMLVKVLDFGIARGVQTHRIARPNSTGEGVVFGTPGYMSPEQAFGAKLDLRADLWALATVSYEALTGELPLRGESVPEMMCSLCAGNLISVHHRRPDLPPGLAAFYDRAFARKIDARFTSATELAVAFARAVGAAPHDRESEPAEGPHRGDMVPMSRDPHPAVRQTPPRPNWRTPQRVALGLALCAALIQPPRSERAQAVGAPGCDSRTAPSTSRAYTATAAATPKVASVNVTCPTRVALPDGLTPPPLSSVSVALHPAESSTRGRSRPRGAPYLLQAPVWATPTPDSACGLRQEPEALIRDLQLELSDDPQKPEACRRPTDGIALPRDPAQEDRRAWSATRDAGTPKLPR